MDNHSCLNGVLKRLISRFRKLEKDKIRLTEEKEFVIEQDKFSLLESISRVKSYLNKIEDGSVKPKDIDISKVLIPDSNTDDRVDLYDVFDAFGENWDSPKDSTLKKLKENADRIVLVVLKININKKHSNSNSELYLDSKLLNERSVTFQGKNYKFCSEKTNFSNQTSAYSLGTGFFLDNNTIITAAHTLFPSFISVNIDDTPQEILFVRKYYFNKINDQILINKEDVFKPVAASSNWWYSMLSQSNQSNFELTNSELDWAHVEVEPYTDYGKLPEYGLEFEKVAKKYPYDRQGVYSFGYGLGLPLKLSYRGNIIDNEKGALTFECNLDFFSGNSGSPIFSNTSHKAIGVLLGGEIDFFIDRDIKCLVPAVFKEKRIGEVCLKTSNILKKIENLEPRRKPSWISTSARKIWSTVQKKRGTTLVDKKGRLAVLNAPYVFLSKSRIKSNSYQYQLFVFIPLGGSNETVVFSEPKKAGRITRVEGEVVEINNGEKRYDYYYRSFRYKDNILPGHSIQVAMMKKYNDGNVEILEQTISFEDAFELDNPINESKLPQKKHPHVFLHKSDDFYSEENHGQIDLCTAKLGEVPEFCKYKFKYRVDGSLYKASEDCNKEVNRDWFSDSHFIKWVSENNPKEGKVRVKGTSSKPNIFIDYAKYIQK